MELDLVTLLEDGNLPDPCIYQYYKNLNNRRIIINDQIDATLLETVILPLLEMDNDGTGKPIEIIEKDTDRDNYMSATEAKEYGVIDEIFVSRKK